jgi:arylsulfatase A-like enzyme
VEKNEEKSMKPNILFLFPDQWRGDWIGQSEIGEKLHTPALRNLMKKGTSFSSAYTPSPLCAPARACIASGRDYPAHGVKNNLQNLPDDEATVYSLLRDADYHVMGCGKFDLHKAEYSWGVDGKHLMKEWGFSDGIDNEGKVDGILSFKKNVKGPYLDFLQKRKMAESHVADFAKRGKYGTDPTELNDEEYCDNWVGNNALELLDRAPEDKPWFLQVNFTGPHDPFDITEEMHKWYREIDFPMPYGKWSKEIDHLSIRKNYAAMMENLDKNISVILSHPRIRNDLENTVIIFSSDHGDMLGDHGYYEKHLPYNGSVHVPLVFSGYKIPENKIIENPVSILDLPATILDLAEQGQQEEMDSLSLQPVINNQKTERKIVTSELYVDNNPLRQWRMAINQDYKYIRWNNGKESLFRCDDYGEETDLIAKIPEDASELIKALGASPMGIK